MTTSCREARQRRKTHVQIVANILLFIALVSTVLAQEQDDRILSFDSKVDIKESGSMIVTETVRVNVAPRSYSKIRHGIFRDFPTRYYTKSGLTMRVRFDVMSVKRDGEKELYRKETMDNGYRVYMGSRQDKVEEGVHTYEMVYSTSRQIGFFKSHDELYWNVSGDGWVFPKDSIACGVTLPVNVDASQVTLEAYTGRKGAKGQEFETTFANGLFQFQTTKEMAGNEDLTVVVMFPKGIVREPSFAQKKLSILVALAGLVLVSSYLWFSLATFVKHPPKGPVVYQSQPPEGISPASARYLMRRGYDCRCFASVIVNLCVKGWLVLEVKKQGLQKRGLDYTLVRTNGVGKKLSSEENDVLLDLTRDHQYLRLIQSNHAEIGQAEKSLTAQLREKHIPNHFTNHCCLLVPAAFGVAFTVLLMLICSDVDFDPVVIFVFPFMSLWLVLLVSHSRCMKPYTPEGQKIVDQLEGFKLFLSMMMKKETSPLAQPREEKMELFEQYLAYAIALGVEKEWSQAFERAISLAEPSSVDYEPMWLAGDRFKSGRLQIIDFYSLAGDVGSSLVSTISSSSTAPGSASGGGDGGSSGGGGGGGGGGGW